MRMGNKELVIGRRTLDFAKQLAGRMQIIAI